MVSHIILKFKLKLNLIVIQSLAGSSKLCGINNYQFMVNIFFKVQPKSEVLVACEETADLLTGYEKKSQVKKNIIPCFLNPLYIVYFQ